MATSKETKATVNNDLTAEQIALRVSNEYDGLSTALEPLPDLLRLLIDKYDLEFTHLTEAQQLDLMLGHTAIYNMLMLTISTIENYLEKQKAIDYRKILERG
jgi:hypothetical protein